ncbi:MAG: sensor domain-containing diguanylate cyclase [Brevinematales bacterium]|nr:sensor domain-containing diguanylate cyclase [Brevinematales bacterium]
MRRRNTSSTTHSGVSAAVDYYESFVKRDRALKIIKEMSEFLRILDLQETEILKTMIVRFAIESVEASQGALVVYDKDKNVLNYQDMYVYENNRIMLESFGEVVKEYKLLPGEGVVGDAFVKETPVLVPNLRQTSYPQPAIGEVLRREIKSEIVVPLKVDGVVEALLEITNTVDKREFNSEDMEVVMIIANFASTILENARHYSLAIHDKLTGLYNTHYFQKEMDEEIERSLRYGRYFSFVIFDIDDFKKINDTYGHSYGDKALKELASCIQRTVRRDVDIAARYGGDEFVLLLTNTRGEEALKVCERLLKLVRTLVISTEDGRSFGFTLSMGVSEFPTHGEEAYYIFNAADDALYQSKAAGKNRVTLYRGPEK